MPIPGTVPLSGPIAPSSATDTYPVTDPRYGLGGVRTVNTMQERNELPDQRRQRGMLVFVIETEKYYYLLSGIGNNDWVEFTADNSYILLNSPQTGEVLIYNAAVAAFQNSPATTLTDGGTF